MFNLLYIYLLKRDMKGLRITIIKNNLCNRSNIIEIHFA